MKKPAACFVFIVFTIMSCSTVTKDDYLLRYKKFIQQVQSEHKNYSENDWLKADRRLNNINTILNKRFGNKLTVEDKITMGTYRMRYDYYRYSGTVKKEINDYVDDLEDEVEGLLRKGVDFLSDSIDSIFREE
jgi:secreted Zn-dependent insulinase-like peptidase